MFFEAKKIYSGRGLYFGRWKSIPNSNFYTLVANILKKVPITLSEKGLGLLGIGSTFKNKFVIGESRKGFKKLAPKKIFNLTMILTIPNPQKIRIFLHNSIS
jgi:hypothetical protein